MRGSESPFIRTCICGLAAFCNCFTATHMLGQLSDTESNISHNYKTRCGSSIISESVVAANHPVMGVPEGGMVRHILAPRGEKFAWRVLRIMCFNPPPPPRTLSLNLGQACVAERRPAAMFCIRQTQNQLPRCS